MGPGVWLRAARRARRVSQRELAELSGVAQATIARIEAETRVPRLDTFTTLLRALRYELVLLDQHGALLTIDKEHERLRDRGLRRFPAHLITFDPRDKDQSWWGWERVAWWPDDPAVPWRGYHHRTRYLPTEVWQDAT